MSQESTRRSFLKHISAAGLASFVEREPSWLFDDEVDERWKGLSKLDGSLLLDEAHREQMATDFGANLHRVPAAVLKPRSPEDLMKIVRFANTHGLKIAMRGQGHSQYGQTLVEGGIVVDSRTLNAVKLGAGMVDAQAGASWEEVTRLTLAQGLTPPAMGDTMTLSVAGILSAGGISNSSHLFGAVVDTVEQVDVVTGAGDLLKCSAQQNRELFELALAGMGQCGLIASAGVRLATAPKWVVRRDLMYDDLSKFLADAKHLAKEAKAEHIGALALADQKQGWTFRITIGKFCASPEDADFRPLVGDLRFKSSEDVMPVPFGLYLHREMARDTAAYAARNRTPSRTLYITMFVPGSVGEEFVGRILASPAETAGVTRFSLYTLPIQKFTRPMFMLPRNEEFALAIFLIRAAGIPIRDGERAYSEAVNTVRGLVEKTSAAGGKVYPPYAPFFSRADWETHYGPTNWRRLVAGKTKFDPKGILTPGTGMFVAQQAASRQ